jgi:hypothetical protein
MTKKKIKKCWWIFNHDWEYLGVWGLTKQQKKCKKCGKLKIVNQ